MSALDNMKRRLEYQGGGQQHARMVDSKLWTLKRALLNSYQAQTAVFETEEGELEFKCLINPDKLKPDYDNKILSIPYKDICLNKPRVGKRTQGEIDVPVSAGTVFKWKETNTYWLCYLQYLEEEAYFRCDIYNCDEDMADVNGHSYHVFLRGPDQLTVEWHTKHKIYWNDLNYTKVMLITKNEETLDYFHRFTKVKVNGKNWEVQVVNDEYADGIIRCIIKEDYTNTPAELAAAEDAEIPQIQDEVMYPYDKKSFFIPIDGDNPISIVNKSQGMIVSLSLVNTIDDIAEISVEVKSGKSGSFDIQSGDILKHVVVKSL